MSKSTINQHVFGVGARETYNTACGVCFFFSLRSTRQVSCVAPVLRDTWQTGREATRAIIDVEGLCLIQPSSYRGRNKNHSWLWAVVGGVDRGSCLAQQPKLDGLCLEPASRHPHSMP